MQSRIQHIKTLQYMLNRQIRSYLRHLSSGASVDNDIEAIKYLNMLISYSL